MCQPDEHDEHEELTRADLVRLRPALIVGALILSAVCYLLFGLAWRFGGAFAWLLAPPPFWYGNQCLLAAFHMSAARPGDLSEALGGRMGGARQRRPRGLLGCAGPGHLGFSGGAAALCRCGVVAQAPQFWRADGL